MGRAAQLMCQCGGAVFEGAAAPKSYTRGVVCALSNAVRSVPGREASLDRLRTHNDVVV